MNSIRMTVLECLTNASRRWCDTTTRPSVRQNRREGEEKEDGTPGATTAQPGTPHAQPSGRCPSTWHELDGRGSFQAAGAGRKRVGYGAPGHLSFPPSNR